MGRKRKSGEGTVRLRKDGRWEGRIVIGYDEKGLPKTKNVLAKTKGECVEKLKALKETITPPTPAKIKADMPFGEWVEYWYETYSKPTSRPSTQRNYETYIRKYIKPRLGNIPEWIGATGKPEWPIGRYSTATACAAEHWTER